MKPIEEKNGNEVASKLCSVAVSDAGIKETIPKHLIVPRCQPMSSGRKASSPTNRIAPNAALISKSSTRLPKSAYVTAVVVNNLNSSDIVDRSRMGESVWSTPTSAAVQSTTQVDHGSGGGDDAMMCPVCSFSSRHRGVIMKHITDFH